MNATLRVGDPVMNNVQTTAGTPLRGPFSGQSMNCRQCHLGDDFLPKQPLYGRTYCDFVRRSPIPRRGDGLVLTERNSPLTVDLSLPREVPQLFHFDGEFSTIEDLVIGTLTGRNFGWLPSEVRTAVAHIAKVIRNDKGTNPRHITYSDGRGIPYALVMRGTDPALPSRVRIPPRYQIDVRTATDDQVLHAMALLMHAYMDSLRFGTDNTGRPRGSSYDLFLERNRLPHRPNKGESSAAYALRLLEVIDQLREPVWVTAEAGQLRLHDQPFRFGAAELQGLKVFFAQPRGSREPHTGNCVACHPPPQFTDNRLHNNGVSQVGYDAIFGRGAFAALYIPELGTRNSHADAYLPPSLKHPKATSRFRSAPSAENPGYTDLGVWNIFANPDVPNPQGALTEILCGQFRLASGNCTAARVLPLTIAYFKTPTVKDLGQSNPYFHSGTADTIEDVVNFYIEVSGLARAAQLRNASPELSDIHIDASDVTPLVAFLKALNEDYF